MQTLKNREWPGDEANTERSGLYFFTQQTNEVLLMSYLATITKGIATTSEVCVLNIGEKFLL